ncbi:hypothetical protein G3578_01845 [Brevibacillus sp. SYP-B805]|uniref:hypothetical protein n=1 Tax=Brevibacillus sp. SYP-B805 TaxID=1578199 RepID=UPI0013E9D465|nr:hypothetical protein [Brevibacillus sp. SYP-B805]NGQ93914.1 hypothetical protein [Brevibacillus sp. SYP-B805]
MLQTTPLMSALLNRNVASSPRQVELSPGQVFKGTVLKLYPDKMALVQIGGMQVHARLETSLEEGQQAWLQVQPSDGAVTLKVISAHPQETADASWQGLLRSLGLPDTPENRSLVKALVNQNLPVTKDVLQAFASISKELGGSDGTIDAFILAMRRHLPLTPETVGALKTFLSDQPLTWAIRRFLTEAERFLQQSAPQPGNGQKPHSSQAVPANVRDAVLALTKEVSRLPLAFGDEVSGELTPQPSWGGPPVQEDGQPLPPGAGQAGSPQADTRTLLQPPRPADGQPQPGQPAATAARPAQSTDGQSHPAGFGTRPMPTAPSAFPDVQGDAGTPSPDNTGTASGRHVPQPSPGQGGERMAWAVTNHPAAAVVQGMSGGPVTPAEGTTTHAEGTTAPADSFAAPADAPAAPADAIAKKESVSPQGREQGEEQAAARPVMQERQEPVKSAAGDRQQAAVPSVSPESGSKGDLLKELFHRLGVSHERELIAQNIRAASADARAGAHLDSIKPLLLQLAQEYADSLPASLKEAAETLVKQITGQQLMMLQPPAQVLSQVVMQIPVRMENGEDTAYVQIEAKKREDGQLDPDNCRLFFHLDLDRLGITMIDVSIVNRIINLQIYNDQPWLEGLVQQSRDQVAGSLREAGYHLSGLRVQPIPELKAGTPALSAREGLYTPYKGVDIRI